MRARGANSILAVAFESTYGTPPGSGFMKMPFVSSNLGEDQGLIASNLLGQGREMLDPTDDVANDTGDLVAPVDVRNFGWWLKLFFGAPSTAAAVSAAGHLKFSAQPAVSSTVTINGTVFTFVASGATGPQSNIGVSLAATLTALATALNASGVSGVAEATYTGTSTQLNVVHDAMGPGGNAFTLAADAPSNATASGATLTGGANTHTFHSGAAALPSMSAEIGMAEVPSYGMNFGIKGDKLKVAMTRSGLLDATLSLIAQGETIAATSGAGTIADALATTRFAQAIGQVARGGVALAGVVTADFTYSNDLEAVEVIRQDGRIDGADEGQAGITGNITVRFADTTLLDQATSRAPCELSFGWAIDASNSLLITAHRVFLPKAKRAVSGPKGIQVPFAWQASTDPTLGRSVTVALTNDVASYA